jgi:transcription initiation factor IIE alpha subunit
MSELVSLDVSKENILKYLKLKIKDFKVQKVSKETLFTCPACEDKLATATFMTGTAKVFCHKCNEQLSIFDIAVSYEADCEEMDDEQIASFLKQHYSIELPKLNIPTFFKFYKDQNFDLVPLIHNQKVPFEKDWLNKEHKDVNEWVTWWFDNNLNLGVKAGKRSGITVVDVDKKELPEWLKDVKTIMQYTTKGYHFLFKYEADIPSSRIEEHKIDILNDGKQFVVYPSVVEGIGRNWEFNGLTEIPVMPKEVKDAITKLFKKGKAEVVKELPQEETYEAILEGSRNNTLIKLGGIIRKRLNSNDTEYMVKLLNKTVIKPSLPDREVDALTKSLERYIDADDSLIGHKILEYLGYAEEGTSKDIEQAVGEKKAKVDKALSFLIKEQYVVKKGRLFHLIKKADWKDVFPTLNPRIKFHMPYFDDVAHFNYGDMILLGSKSKFGKTTVSMNIVKRLVEQGIKPYYICLEPGSRFIATGCTLGLKEGDFYWDIQTDPTKVDLEKNAVTILDWLMIENKAETDTIMHHFIKQLVRTNGILICFMQLKADGTWFAPNMTTQFPAFASRYLYDDESGSTGTWHIDAIRESKRNIKTGKIPCKYLWEEKKLVRIDEIPLVAKKVSKSEELEELAV